MYHLGDVVQMKKPHACGENKWEILRMGADIRIKCLGCGHLIMMPRAEFNKKLKKAIDKWGRRHYNPYKPTGKVGY